MPRVILHIDVDSFYCECARLRYPHLRGKPLAITQDNRGGFVAVSYEAKACGVRKGDGIGDEGRRRLPGFRDRPALELVLQRCPTLNVLPMDMAYYRRCTASIAHELRRLFHVVRQSSVDDFYCDATAEAEWLAAMRGPGPYSESAASAIRPALVEAAEPMAASMRRGRDTLEPPTHVAAACHQIPAVGAEGTLESDPVWTAQQREALPDALRAGCVLAARARDHVRAVSGGLMLSAGIATNCLLARQVSPRNRPARQTVLPPGLEEAFAASLPILRVPGFRHQAGRQLCDKLGVTTLGQLRSRGVAEIRAALPPAASAKAQWLHRAAHGEDSTAADELDPHAQRLATELLSRLQEHLATHRQLPTSLTVRWRVGYNAAPTSRSLALPPRLSSAIAAGGSAGRQRIGLAFFSSVRDRAADAASEEDGGPRGPTRVLHLTRIPATVDSAREWSAEEQEGIDAACTAVAAAVAHSTSGTTAALTLTKLGITAGGFTPAAGRVCTGGGGGPAAGAGPITAWLAAGRTGRGDRKRARPESRPGPSACRTSAGAASPPADAVWERERPASAAPTVEADDTRLGSNALPPSALEHCGSPTPSLASTFSVSPGS